MNNNQSKSTTEGNNGYQSPRFTEQEIIAIVERELPEFTKICLSQEAENVLLTQDAFATDYLMGEFTLLAFAVKYAGIKNKILTIIPNNK